MRWSSDIFLLTLTAVETVTGDWVLGTTQQELRLQLKRKLMSMLVPLRAGPFFMFTGDTINTATVRGFSFRLFGDGLRFYCTI